MLEWCNETAIVQVLNYLNSVSECTISHYMYVILEQVEQVNGHKEQASKFIYLNIFMFELTHRYQKACLPFWSLAELIDCQHVMFLIIYSCTHNLGSFLTVKPPCSGRHGQNHHSETHLSIPLSIGNGGKTFTQVIFLISLDIIYLGLDSCQRSC